MDTLLTRDKTPTPSSWEMNLPDRCDDPNQAKGLYHNAHSWIEELRGRTEPPAYPLRTLMNVVNATDLLREEYPEEAYALEDALKELELEPGELSKEMQKCLGRVTLAIHNFYHPKTDAAPAEIIMKQFNQQNLPIRDDIILQRLSGSGSRQLTLEEVRQQARQAVETKLDPKTIQTIYHQPTDIDK
ncbi:hypothetical protein FBF32_01055 [Candidatus Saccharibacteria bacterium oral taxon 488]|nr:hypothetical protein FBF32_01055 [Candidatus Saccharibacteria bacterium oral taxon 488]